MEIKKNGTDALYIVYVSLKEKIALSVNA